MALGGREVTVLGGGIAGLAAALACARRGARVRVLEQAPEIAEIGAGLQISPNGAVVLQALGLGDALARASVPAEAVELREGAGGGRVLRLDLARAAGAGRAGYHFIHRADLVALLARGARAAGVQLETSRRIDRVEIPRGGPARLIDAQGAVRPAALLLGADGLHSVLRPALDPGAARARFTGQVAWRAVIAAEPGARAVAQVFMGPGRHLVSYPLRAGRARNIVAVEERRGWTGEGWHQGDDPARLRAAFAGFGGPVPGWLARLEAVHLWGLFRQPVAARWHDGGGRAALLGDAAHPTLPFLAQGANMALEDAWVLAESLDRHDTPAAALAAYQRARRDRAVRIIAAAARNARAYHLRAPLRPLAHAALRLGARLAPDAALNRFDWLYGYDVTQGA
ncbi:monooxygenase [Rhodobacteraceae bacterium WD3A24]|nr:monooxygenase [Rhodobacteraceae bacterium WD3A24]